MVLKPLINLFFPSLCAGCNNPLGTGQEVICTACRIDLPYVNSPFDKNNAIAKVFWGRCDFKHTVALLYFQKHNTVQNILHALKYKNRIEVGQVFGHEIGGLFLKQNIIFDALVPIPLHPSKLRSRGYNQSEAIANGICEKLGTPVLKNVLIKTSTTSSQTQKSRIERWKNSQEKFESGNQQPPENILLVDDVITTGATLEACYNVLKNQYPFCNISVAALAYTYR